MCSSAIDISIWHVFRNGKLSYLTKSMSKVRESFLPFCLIWIILRSVVPLDVHLLKIADTLVGVCWPRLSLLTDHRMKWILGKRSQTFRSMYEIWLTWQQVFDKVVNTLAGGRRHFCWSLLASSKLADRCASMYHKMKWILGKHIQTFGITLSNRKEHWPSS